MKYYVVHNPALTERKEKLEAQFKKFGIVDCEWVTTFPAEDMEHVKEFTNSPMTLGYISCSMKHYDAFQRLVDSDEKEAIIFEDDVILTEIFDERYIPKIFPYVSLNMGPPGNQIKEPSRTSGFKNNNGGAEAYYVKKMFAREFLEHINLLRTMDMETYWFWVQNTGSVYIPWIPMCYQNYGETTMNGKATTIEYDEEWDSYILRGNQKTYTFKNLRDLCSKDKETSLDKSEPLDKYIYLDDKSEPLSNGQKHALGPQNMERTPDRACRKDM